MEGVKGVKGGLARAWPGGLDGLTLLKGVDCTEEAPPSVWRQRHLMFECSPGAVLDSRIKLAVYHKQYWYLLTVVSIAL